ncbi:MAG: 50S ribosomal protein L4 [Planctomycetota bacterium]
MITLPIHNAAGAQVSTVEIDPAEFGGTVNKQLLHDVVVMHQANLRVGTHFTKTRGEVAGSGKKLFRQKGTGNARVGQKRSPKRRGGGVAWGPKPRDYSYYLPKKARRNATRSALLSKLLDQEAVVVDGLSLGAPKTKDMTKVLKALGLSGETCLVTTNGVDRNVYLSGRNIHGVEVLPVGELNAYAILRRKRLLLTTQALEALRASAKANSNEGNS